MSGSVGNFVRRRNDNPQSSQESQAAIFSRRQAVAAQVKITRNSRPAASFQQPQQFSGQPPALHRRSQSIPRNNVPEMITTDQRDGFPDSEAGSDFENTVVVENDREDEERYPSEELDGNKQSYDGNDYAKQQKRARGKLGFNVHRGNEHSAAQDADPHVLLTRVTGWNQIPEYEQIVSETRGISPNTLRYSSRFHGVGDDVKPVIFENGLEMDEIDEDEDDRASRGPYQHERLRRNHNLSHMDAGLELKQSQIKQSQERPDDMSSEEGDIAESPLRNKHRDRNDMSGIAEVSYHNEMPSTDPPDNFEGSRSSSYDHITPRGSNRDMRVNEPLEGPPRLKRTVAELDYDEEALHKMKYSELKEQAFDNNPEATPPVIPEFLSGPDVSVEERLKHFASAHPDLQSKFFEQMPIDEWELAGDWFLNRFGEIMLKLKDARGERRQVSKQFEDELAAREDAVQENIEGIDQTLAKMKEGGMVVLQGQRGSA